MLKAILISSAILNIGLLLGRISGFIRQSFIANAYGDSSEADVVVMMLTIPDLLVRVLTGGALGAVLIPAFANNTEQARKLLYQATVIYGSLTFVVSVFLFWQSELLVSFLAPGWKGDQIINAAQAVSFVVILIPLTVMAGCTTAYLQHKNKFTVPSLGTLIVNVSIIIGLYMVYRGSGKIQLLACFVVFGGSVRLATQVWAIKPSWSPILSLQSILVGKTFLKHYGRAMLAGSILIFFPAIAKAFASFFVEGSYATMDYSLKLIQFPLVIAVTFIATIFLPRLSSAYQSNKELFTNLFKYGIQATVAISCIATVALFYVSEQYSSLVYQHGKMEEESVRVVGSITSIGLLSLPLQGLVMFLTMTCFAQKDTKTPLFINGIGLMVFIGLNVFALFGENLNSLMWTLVVSYGCIFLLYALLFKGKETNVICAVVQLELLAPLIVAIVLLCGVGELISRQTLSPLTAVSLSFLSGVTALLLVTVTHGGCRRKIMNWLWSR